MRTGLRILQLPVTFGHAMSAMVEKGERWTADRAKTSRHRERRGKSTGELRTMLGTQIAGEAQRILKGRASGSRGYGKPMDACKLI